MRRTLIALVAAAIAVTSSVGSAQTMTSKTDAATLRAAADAGDAKAMMYLALKYNNAAYDMPDEEARANHAQAAVWLRKASELGFVGAMYSLGTYYWSGRGVAKDLVEAYKWIYLSGQAQTGVQRDRSAQTCESLARVMSAAQVAEAKQRVAAWQTAFAHKKQPL